MLKSRMLVLRAMHGLSLARIEFLVADRPGWMRVCGLGPGDAVPDANTLWDFREALIISGALDALFARLDRTITQAGYLPMAGRIVDAALVAAPRQRNGKEEKARIKAGESAEQIRPDKPARARQTGEPIVAPMVRAQPRTHISIDRRHGVIRRAGVTDAFGPALGPMAGRPLTPIRARLREGLIDPSNTGSDVRADSACRSAENKRFLAGIGKVSRSHRRKPKGRPMPSARPGPAPRNPPCAHMSGIPPPIRRGRRAP